MDVSAARKIIEVQEVLLLDERYQQLNAEYDLYGRQFAEVLRELSPRQRSVVEDYLGVCVEMHLRMLEAACG